MAKLVRDLRTEFNAPNMLVVSGRFFVRLGDGLSSAMVEMMIIRPTKWIFRILQETKGDGFKPCGNVKISGNEFIFRREDVGIEINIGGGTAPETFVFENNRWFAEDKPTRSKPKLPVEETGGRYE